MSEISGKWYQSLFWLLIVCTVARTISNGEGDGRLYTLLWFVNILATVVYGAVLLKMEHFSAHFRMGPIFWMAACWSLLSFWWSLHQPLWI